MASQEYPLLSMLMHTCYIYDCEIIQRKLKEVLSNNFKVDLALCRFGPASAQLLYTYFRDARYHFICSENEALDAILQHNYHAGEANRNPIQKVPLVLNFKSIKDCSEYIGTLKEGIVYSINASLASRQKVSFLTLLALTRPNITVDACDLLQGVFDFVRQSWKSIGMNRHEDVYQEVIGVNDIFLRKVNPDGTVYIPGVGKMPESVYVSNYRCLPLSFGRDVLIKEDGFRNAYKTAVKGVVVRPEYKNSIRTNLNMREEKYYDK